MQINAKVFEELVGEALPAVAVRTSIAALRCVNLFRRENNLCAVGTDLEIGIEATTDDLMFDGAEAVDCCVDAKRLHRVLKEIDGELDVKMVGSALNISNGTATFELQTISPENYPPLPKCEDMAEVVMPGLKLQSAISSVLHSVSHDDNRYVLNSVLLEFNGGHLDVVSTDGRRLTHVKINDDDASAQFNALDGQKLILPENTAKIIGGQQNANLVLFCGSNEVMVKSDDLTIISKQIEGVFPNWKQVVPYEYDVEFIFEVKAALHAIRRVALMVSDAAPSVNIRIDAESNTVHLTAENADSGAARDSFDLVSLENKMNHERIVFSLNPQYFTEAIKGSGCDKICVRMLYDKGCSPLRFFNEESAYQSVLMPMRYNAAFERPIDETNGVIKKELDEREEVKLVQPGEEVE